MDTTARAPQFLRYHHEYGHRMPYEFNGLGTMVDEVIAGMDRDAQAMGHQEFQTELTAHKGFDPETGLNYAMLHGGAPERTSTNRAIILHAALGISLDEMVPLAEMIRRISDELELSDDMGLPLPVVVTGTPDYEFARRLNTKDRHDLRKGDLGVIGRQNLQLVNHLLPRQPGQPPLEAILIGYSLGTANAAASAKYAPNFNIHAEALIMGATPNVIYRRGLSETLGSFIIEGARGNYPKGTSKVFAGVSDNPVVFLGTLLKSLSFYGHDILPGISSLSAASTVLEAWRNNGKTMQLSIGGSTHDLVGRDEPTMRMVKQLSTRIPAEGLESMTVVKKHHAWSRDLGKLARMLAYGLDPTKDGRIVLNNSL